MKLIVHKKAYKQLKKKGCNMDGFVIDKYPGGWFQFKSQYMLRQFFIYITKRRVK